jgi:hypothetical protein
VALIKSQKVNWSDIFYAPIINIAVCNVTLLNKFPQPCSGFWVNFVVISCHLPTLTNALPDRK